MAAPMKRFLTRVVPQTGEKALGSVIFLHGSGDTGPGIQEWVNHTLRISQLQFPHLRLLFPTAPARPYTPNLGNYSNVWYDRKHISPMAPDDESVEQMGTWLSELVEHEIQHEGIPTNNIVIGGFSMGGGMALQMGYRFLKDIAGVFAMSSFLGTSSLVYQELERLEESGSSNRTFPPLFMSHGEEDTLVLYNWGQTTYERLTELGVKGEFHSVPDLLHELDHDSMTKLCSWILNRVPLPTSL